MSTKKQRAIVLFSGGLDSSTCLALAKSRDLECYALSFDYQQRQRAELDAAQKVAQAMKVKEHRLFRIAIEQFGGSALTDEQLEVPAYKADGQIPITYVPARNTIFLSIALGWAEVVDASYIYIGASSVDYSGYPDCRPEYMSAFQDMANLATKNAVEGHPIEIVTPLMSLSKAETIQLGQKLGVDYALTVSCYQADQQGQACGHCDSCFLRKQGFAKAGVADPTRYQAD